MFAFFEGEAWGYLGSKLFMQDITSFDCKQPMDGYCALPYRSSLAFQKIKVDKLKYIIETSQVGNIMGSPPSLYIHQEKNQPQNTPIINELQNHVDLNVTVAIASSTAPGIPPSSLMSFLKSKPSIAGIVLADHNAQYTNKYYHSRFDDFSNVDPVNLATTATLLARTAFNLAGGNISLTDSIIANQTLASVLLDCFTNTLYCDYAAPYLADYNFYSQPSEYTSVYRQNALLVVSSKLVHDIISEFTAQKREGTCKADKDCSNVQLCLRNRCVTTSTYYHDAFSLGIQDKKVVDTSQSTWTESVWDEPFVEYFMMDNPINEIIFLVFGIAEVGLSFLVVWLLRRFFTKRFNKQ